jgi:hypothetical protein
MSIRYYLYAVHASRTFLLAQSLGSALYLILLRLLHRDYGAAFRLAETCTVAVPFTPEEQRVFNQFARTLDDCHPDAHACRLKILLSVMHCETGGSACGWEATDEMDRYLLKLPHVSADCRLGREEELDVLRRCKRGTPRIKNRLRMLSAPAGTATVALSAGVERSGGQPWLRLCQTGWG